MWNKRQSLFAFIGATLFYGGFIVLFDYTPSLNAHNQPSHLADVIFLSIDKSQANDWQKNLIASLELLDPTVLSLPNPHHGFSRIRSFEFERPVEPFPDYEFTIAEIQHSLFPPITLTTPINDVLAAINNFQNSQLQINQDATPKYPTLNATMYWSNHRGEIMPRIPIIPNDALSRLGDQIVTTGPSIFLAEQHQKLTRIKIVTSCGAPELDQIGLLHLQQYFSRIHFLSPAEGEDNNAMLIPDHGLILGHWRLVPGINEQKTMQKEKPFDVPNWF